VVGWGKLQGDLRTFLAVCHDNKRCNTVVHHRASHCQGVGRHHGLLTWIRLHGRRRLAAPHCHSSIQFHSGYVPENIRGPNQHALAMSPKSTAW